MLDGAGPGVDAGLDGALDGALDAAVDGALDGAADADPVIDDDGGEGDGAVGGPDLGADGGFVGDPLDVAILSAMSAGRVPGLAGAIIKGGRVVWAKGYGVADVAQGVPATEDTAFHVAHVGDAVVAAAVLQSVGAGRIGLDEGIGPRVPFRVAAPQAPMAPVTLRQLLTHTSGIRDRIDVLGAAMVIGDPLEPLDEFLAAYLAPGGALYSASSWGSVPGADVEPSRVGVALAAYVAERLSGDPFHATCAATLFTPLMMSPAGWRLADLGAAPVALPYQWVLGRWLPYQDYGFTPYPASQLRASAKAMGRFLAALAAGGTLDGARVLDPALIDEMWRPQVPQLEPDQALLWRWRDSAHGRLVGLTSIDRGAMAALWYRPADGVGVVLLMNSVSQPISAVENLDAPLFEASAKF